MRQRLRCDTGVTRRRARGGKQLPPTLKTARKIRGNCLGRFRAGPYTRPSKPGVEGSPAITLLAALVAMMDESFHPAAVRHVAARCARRDSSGSTCWLGASGSILSQKEPSDEPSTTQWTLNRSPCLTGCSPQGRPLSRARRSSLVRNSPLRARRSSTAAACYAARLRDQHLQGSSMRRLLYDSGMMSCPPPPAAITPNSRPYHFLARRVTLTG